MAFTVIHDYILVWRKEKPLTNFISSSWRSEKRYPYWPLVKALKRMFVCVLDLFLPPVKHITIPASTNSAKTIPCLDQEWSWTFYILNQAAGSQSSVSDFPCLCFHSGCLKSDEYIQWNQSTLLNFFINGLLSGSWGIWEKSVQLLESITERIVFVRMCRGSFTSNIGGLFVTNNDYAYHAMATCSPPAPR